MSRLYHTLVVLGGALVGCGDGAKNSSDPAQTSAGSDGEDNGAGSHTTAAQENGEDESTASVPTEVQTAPTTENSTAGPPNSTIPTEALAMEAVDAGSSFTLEPENSPVDGGAETAVGEAPDDCATEQWQCGPAGCDFEAECLGPTGDPSAPPRPAPVASTCACDSSAPTSAADCATGQTLVCLYGDFLQEDGSMEALPYDCRCIEPDASSGRLRCTAHPNASAHMTSTVPSVDATSGPVWCGNCAVPLIR